MTNGICAHPGELRAAALVFADDGVDLWAALGWLQSSLDGLVGMCGTTDSGRIFAATYDPNRRSIEAALGSLAKGLAAVHDGLADMADMADSYDYGDRRMPAPVPSGSGR